jgi:hypothetical protein
MAARGGPGTGQRKYPLQRVKRGFTGCPNRAASGAPGTEGRFVRALLLVSRSHPRHTYVVVRTTDSSLTVIRGHTTDL